MTTSMLLMTAWIAGADVVPAGCASCAAPAPAVVAAPVVASADCGCDTCGSAAASPKLGLFTKLKGLFASKGKHHKSAACDTCAEPAPACDGCSAPAAAPDAGHVVTPAPVDAPKVMPAVPPAPVPAPLPPKAPVKEKVSAPASGFDIPVVSPVSDTQKKPVLGNSANPF